MIEVQLTGSTTASALGVDHNEPKQGPIGPLIRKLIETGLCQAETPIIVKRGTTEIFRPKPAHEWSGYDVKDGDAEGLKRIPYRPSSYRGKATHSVEALAA